VGQQEISARDFPVLREVSTFSWLGVRHHGSGIGTQMRAAVLHLAFAGLGATDAISGAFDDNIPSLPPGPSNSSGSGGYPPPSSTSRSKGPAR
jgi:RimJ/RimL family protein N-acetyltransferase